MNCKPSTTFLETEESIIDEVHKYKLEFAELSPLIRELLGAVYIRGGLDALKKINIKHNA